MGSSNNLTEHVIKKRVMQASLNFGIVEHEWGHHAKAIREFDYVMEKCRRWKHQQRMEIECKHLMQNAISEKGTTYLKLLKPVKVIL